MKALKKIENFISSAIMLCIIFFKIKRIVVAKHGDTWWHMVIAKLHHGDPGPQGQIKVNLPAAEHRQMPWNDGIAYSAEVASATQAGLEQWNNRSGRMGSFSVKLLSKRMIKK